MSFIFSLFSIPLIHFLLAFTYAPIFGFFYTFYLLFEFVLTKGLNVEIDKIDNPYIKIMQGWYLKMKVGNQTSKNSKEYPKINSKDYNITKKNR